MDKYIGLKPFPPDFHEKFAPIAKVIEEKCIGCERCPKICFFDAIKMNNKIAVVNQDNCTGCGLCFEACPVDAIIWVPDESTQTGPFIQRYGVGGIEFGD